MAEHGVSKALYLRDPDGIGVELTWDRPPEEWPRDENISLVPINDSLDVNELLEGYALRSAMFTTLFPERRPHRRTCKYMSLLLCELHAHTTWSDGELSLQELVDLYGRAGFDVLCVTDHTHPPGDPWERLGIRPERQAAYFAAVEREAERAWSEHGLLVLPGLELTDNAPDPDSAAHVVAVGLRTPVSLERGIESGIASARAAGAVIVAAHPAGPEGGPGSTRRLWRERDAFHQLIDRWELINGHTAFPWVADARLPVVANGDFHRREHLATWKTLLPCEQDEEATLKVLRSRALVHLTVFDPAPKSVAA